MLQGEIKGKDPRLPVFIAGMERKLLNAKDVDDGVDGLGASVVGETSSTSRDCTCPIDRIVVVG